MGITPHFGMSISDLKKMVFYF